MSSNWPLVPLYELTTKVGSGATPRGGKNVYNTDGTAFIRSQNVHDNEFSFDGLARITESAAKALDGVRVDTDDVLVCITGESVTRTSLVDPKALPARVSQHVAIVRADKERLEPRYLKAALLSPDIKGQLNSLSEAGATRRALTKAHLQNLRIPLPPLSEQKRIARVLGAIDELVNVNEQLASTMDELFHSIWTKLCTDVATPVAKLTLADFCTTQYGHTAPATSAETGVQMLRVTDINKQNWVEWEKVPFCQIDAVALSKYRLNRGDLLVARMADPGKSAMVERDVDAVFASYLVRLKPHRDEMSLYLFGFLKSSAFAEYAAGAMTGSVQKHMNAKVIAAAPITPPNAAVIAEFNRIATPIREQLATCISEAQRLRRTRAELLPLLLSGGIWVDDSMGPGAEGLEWA
ncbi:restriction endonuclease subunit S [Glaciibacter psychrotolerans]|uniref:Type I restriction enzyme S subunit n=1 Tax=Glaciibacter psychrotolerans TaxID=670054 RepID=A0A7Z0ECN5_9MICO|nr:restriction endonuclease subunit S [Leifsonia psychrotolerans]NYJ18482.1 type I restriction enzyme S subunit [Leifsonia psychrotolerans]